MSGVVGAQSALNRPTNDEKRSAVATAGIERPAAASNDPFPLAAEILPVLNALRVELTGLPPELSAVIARLADPVMEWTAVPPAHDPHALQTGVVSEDGLSVFMPGSQLRCVQSTLSLAECGRRDLRLRVDLPGGDSSVGFHSTMPAALSWTLRWGTRTAVDVTWWVRAAEWGFSSDPVADLTFGVSAEHRERQRGGGGSSPAEEEGHNTHSPSVTVAVGRDPALCIGNDVRPTDRLVVAGIGGVRIAIL
jgi:hypothetical protein